MNHDITHCSGTNNFLDENAKIICPKRNTCHRYIAYIDLENYFKNTDSSLVSMTRYDENKECKLYWKEK